MLHAVKVNKFVAINGTSSKFIGNVIQHQVLRLPPKLTICSKSICKSRKTSTQSNKAKQVAASPPTPSEPRNPDKWLYKKICTKSKELCSQTKEKINKVCEMQNSKKPLDETCPAGTIEKRNSKVNEIIVNIRSHPIFTTNYSAKVREKIKDLKNKMNTFNDRFIANFVCGTRSKLKAFTKDSKRIQTLSKSWRELEIESREAKEARKKYIKEIQKKLPKRA